MKPMLGVVYYGLLVLTMLMHGHYCQGHSSESIEHLYKNASDALLSICKEVPLIQTKVYASHDHLDKMHAAAKALAKENQQLKKKLQAKEDEHAALKKNLSQSKQDLAVLQQSLQTTQGSLDDSNKKLTEEKERSNTLSAQHTKLLDKVAGLDTIQGQQEKTTLACNDDQKGGEVRALAAAAAQKVKEKYGHNFKRNSTSEPSSPR